MSQVLLDISKPLHAETDEEDCRSLEEANPCFRLPMFASLVPFLWEWTHQRKLTSDTEEETALKHMALEISNDDLGYSPPRQVSVGNESSSAIMSCSTLAESCSEEDAATSPIEIHRCSSCSFRVSLGWRFCPECGTYIDGVTTTQTINTLDVTMLESNVDTPRREESFVVEDLLDELE